MSNTTHSDTIDDLNNNLHTYTISPKHISILVNNESANLSENTINTSQHNPASLIPIKLINEDNPSLSAHSRSAEPSSTKTINVKTRNERSRNDKTRNDKTDKLRTVKTTCPYCGVGCGVLASINTVNGEVSVEGDPDHPANYGKLCSKGSNLAQTLGTERRLMTPYYQNKKLSMRSPADATDLLSEPLDGRLNEPLNEPLNQSIMTTQENSLSKEIESSNWEPILDDIADRLSKTIEQHGRDSVMLYVSGQLLTEDYYVANKFIKGFIGNNNIDSNSRLCMSSAVAGHKRAFGADLVPGSYTDFETCDLLVLVGSNMAWCHPILFGRFLKAKQDNPNKKLIVIDPRRTDSCEFADLHLPLAPGTDTHLFNGLLNYLNTNGYQDTDYAKQCLGLDEALASASAWDIESVAKATQLDADTVEQFYNLFANNAKTVTAFSMGVNQSSSGTDKVNAIINTHLLTGRVGKEGASPFSLTGQPNAMGGREVGALANLLAGHLELDNADHRQAVADFWQAPQAIVPNVGVKACDAADAILDGRIKAIWIMATNPVVSLPEADKFRRALAECELVIVSECSKDSDTIKCADIVLPAQGWGEKSGTVTNSERQISRQRSLMPAAGDSKPDWWILSQVAKRMGYAGFDYQHPSEIFSEHAALTSYQQDNYPRQLDLLSELSLKRDANNESSFLNNESPVLTENQYDAMLPFQWGGARINVVDKHFKHNAPRFITIKPPEKAGAINRFTPKQDRLNPAKIKAQSQTINSTQTRKDIDELTTSSNMSANNAINLRLITGRLRDQWHTMTRTGLAPKLNQQQTIPTITLHPKDAETLGVVDQQFVSISPERAFEYALQPTIEVSSSTFAIAQVEISDEVRVGDAFMPMHWSNAFANLARVGVLIPTKVDPISSQPELKNSAITVNPISMQTVGRLLVHPDWLDAVLVQLRGLSASINSTDQGVSSTELPNIVWSLSRQQDSILINIATSKESVSSAWLTSTFWQKFVASVEELANGESSDLENSSIGNNSSIANDIFMKNASFVENIKAKQFRMVVIDDTSGYSHPDQPQLMLAVYIAPEYDQLPSTHWLNECFVDMRTVPSTKWLLAGRPASGYVDPGPIVCACMGVGENIIINAVKNDKATDAITVGKLCQAGTNCGSCVGQINELIKEYA